MYRIIGADGQEYGPVTLEVVRQWIAEGRANNQTRILPEGTTEWKLLADFPELASTSAGPTRPATAPSRIEPLPRPPRSNPLALTGMVLGLLSLTLGLCCYGLPFNLAGLVCSVVALLQIRKDPVSERGQGLAIAGLVLSLLSIAFAALILVFHFTFGSSDFLRRMRRL